MEQNDQSLALPCRGDERRSVRKPRPRLGRESGVRLGEHLARNGYLISDGQAKKRTLAVEGRKFFWGIPGHRAAQHAAAAAQPDRNEIAGGRCEMGSGKAHEDSAVLHKTREPVMRLTGTMPTSARIMIATWSSRSETIGSVAAGLASRTSAKGKAPS